MRPQPAFDPGDTESTTALAPGLCILLVEDDEADAYLIHRALWRHPAVGKIVHVRDGVEALATVERRGLDPDLAFIDLRMPRMGGFDLLDAFAHEDGPECPMVVLTSSSAPVDAIQSRARSAVSVIVKPQTVAEMSTALKDFVDAVWRGGRKADWRRDPVDVQIPLALRDSARAAAVRRAAARLRARLLAAADSPADQQALAMLLAAVGVGLTSATAGQEAVDVWRMGDWDVELSDIEPPGPTPRTGRAPPRIGPVSADPPPTSRGAGAPVALAEALAAPIDLALLLDSLACAIQPRAAEPAVAPAVTP
jgi:CheY-like chemotaxis protein